MKYIKTVVAIYIISFIFFLILLFPYTNFIDWKLKKFIANYKLPFQYSNLNVSLFSTKINNITAIGYKNFFINTIKIKYSPVSLLIKKKFQIEINKSEINLKLNKNSLLIQGIINKNSFPNFDKYLCDYLLKGKIDLSHFTGNLQLKNLSLCSIKTQLGEFAFNSFEIDLLLDRKKIKINLQGYSKNKKVLLKGTLMLNNNKIENSLLSLTGYVKLNNLKKRIQIKGIIKSPKVIIR